MKKILMIAYHFPPLAGSSGIQRTLRFVQHLPALGWQPLVLSASPFAYERTSHDLDREVPEGTIVRRAFALDTARHLSFRGRYLSVFARPDRWISWRFDALRVGRKMVRQFEPDAIWSTYPIATAHLIGAALSQRTGLPWIADFRDPMAQDGYPADPITRQQYRNIEQHAVLHAKAATFTTPGAARIYSERYPASAKRIAVIENGYDEESFTDISSVADITTPLNPGAVTLLHSGIVYPQERDPTQLMNALQKLAASGVTAPGDLKIRFRASMQDQLLRSLALERGISHFIEVLPPIDYKEALVEMLRADGLLLMQASDCNEQIPAKLYEYLRARRPIVCLSDPAGDTVGLLRSAGVTATTRLDDANGIVELLSQFLANPADHHGFLPSADFVARASRAGRAQELAALLNQIVSR